MRLAINMLLRWSLPGVDPWIERVLWLDAAAAWIIVIALEDAQPLPIQRTVAEVEAALGVGTAGVVDADPYAHLVRSEGVLSERQRQRRDAAWAVIQHLVLDEDGRPSPMILFAAQRGRLIQQVVEATGWQKKRLYRLLRRYWLGGQIKNALLPRYDRSGGKGKPKGGTAAKLGRPSALSRATGQLRGVRVTAEMRQIFVRGHREFYAQHKQRPLTDAFHYILAHYFQRGFERQKGDWVPKLPPADQLPTFRQFRYWCRKDLALAEEVKRREGSRRFAMRYREVLGDTTRLAFGPGALVQVDATIGDVYLVSALDRTRLIGRPVIYVLIDVFSRLIVGLAVLLEGPSWLGAVLALANMTTDKVAFCQEYGIAITQQDWPSHHLPEALLADRGELFGYNADVLTQALNVRVQNTPPYRADWKGIIERQHRLSNERLIHWLPGATYPRVERGGDDYRLDAALTLTEFTQLMIHAVLYHNKHHRMDWYTLEPDMIRDHVAPYPCDLWHWGLQHRAGALRTLSQEVVRVNLLPRAEASVTPAGLLFKGLQYTCERAHREGWFTRARIQGRWRVPIAYHPRSLATIYLLLEDERHIEPCTLYTPADTVLATNWYDRLDYLELQLQAKEQARTEEYRARAAFHAHVEHITTHAQAETLAALQVRPLSPHQRVSDITAQRQENQALLDTAQLGSPPDGGQGTVPEQAARASVPPPTPVAEDESYIPPAQSLELLRGQLGDSA